MYVLPFSDFGRPRFADPLTNITVEIDISVSGAALGGLQRYVSIQGLTVKEGMLFGPVVFMNRGLKNIT